MNHRIVTIGLLLTLSTVLSAETPQVVLDDFHLVGELSGTQAAFTLTATARIEESKGATLELASGALALTELGPHPKWRLRAEQNRFLAVFERAGKYPIQLKFNAAVRQNDGWRSVEFRVAPSLLHPVILRGLSPDTQFEFPGAARPERVGEEFKSHLPADGLVKLSWKEARPETEGKLFYATEMFSQISVSPGLMRQVALLDFKVMQGELSRMTLLVRGAGEVTRVQGEHVLAWNLEPAGNSAERRLAVQFNQPQKDQFSLLVQVQTPLGTFPQTAEAIQLRPETATRFAGYFRIVNEGAVRLEVAQASGLSQISPEQFPESDATRSVLRLVGNQRFVYRFSGADFTLKVQADQIQPELAVSELLSYRLGENELAIDAEIELDIREAPLRDLVLRIPKGYAIAKLAAPGLTDYFLRETEADGEAPGTELRLVYGQPASGRQVIQLRLERNKPLGESSWALPRIDVAKAKSVRGHLAASADAGFRLTPERTQGLTEIATAFFPRKVAGIQSAFRLSDAVWQAGFRVERLPQTVQVDALHLFSIAEGVAYGSSLLNYVVSGAPVGIFKVELSDEYYNVEFTGKDIRTWQKTDGGYTVQLHTPVSGAYTLLATYERPFKAQGDTLTFTGARPLDAQSEQGHTLITSAYQFQVKPADVSPGLLALETGEVPPEYRLFFDAPILAAYRYVARPFNLKLGLSPLTQGDSLSQVVDRASLTTRISKEGQVLTDVRYFVKNRGNPHLRLRLPAGTTLWSVAINDAPVVPVTDTNANLIPLPQGADPNAVLRLDLKLAAAPSKDPHRVAVAAPILSAPVMLAEWKLEPDTGQRLVYRSGSLTPAGGMEDVSGFAQAVRTFASRGASWAWTCLLLCVFLVVGAIFLWHWASLGGVHRGSARHVLGTVLGVLFLALAGIAGVNLADTVKDYGAVAAREVSLLAPVQQAQSALQVEVLNLEDKVAFVDVAGYAWPVVAALGLLVLGWLAGEGPIRKAAALLGWLVLAWGALHLPNGFTVFLLGLAIYVAIYAVIPGLLALWQLPPRPQPAPANKPDRASASAAMLLASGLLWIGTPGRAAEPPSTNAPALTDAVADSVTQTLRIEDKFALATATIGWTAEKGESLPLLLEPGVLTRVRYPTNALKLETASAGAKAGQRLVARKKGSYEIEVQYELRVGKKDTESGVTSAVPAGLINRLDLTVVNLDVDVFSPQAVSIQREVAGSNTFAKLVLSPVGEAWVGWKPRSRDVKREKAVFYVEMTQLYAPAAGVIEGAHYASIRPAQGELSELVLDVPPRATITDVLDPARAKAAAESKAAVAPSIVGLWRFDPDTRKLRVTLNPPQSRAFLLLIRSQTATGPLPFEQAVGLLRAENAAGQIGLLGLATGNEVQLDTVKGESLASINLEDFPGDAVSSLQGQIPGLTVRRAFRYADTQATAALKASPVEPDIRVETQDTLSLGEDRTILAANATVAITRAGIFRLSFGMPAGFDVESITGPALSHWTESKSEAGRIITLHLNGKTEGQQPFTISLAGPGVKATNGWVVPQLMLREAGKQRGTLLLVPEQGLRLQVASSEGLTQLDPQKSGIKQKGVLAFRVLQTPRSLTLNLEQVDPWIQVTSLQHATVNEAQVKVVANLQYQIENTGLKLFRVYLPTNAEGVRFQGEQVADFLPAPGTLTNGLQAWDIKLHRRILGACLLQVAYQVPVPDQAQEVVLRGVQAADVNLQRGFVTIQSGGRLQVRSEAPPSALQATEWQSIPRTLQQGLSTSAANFSYRLVETAFELPLKLERHEAARLLDARIENITFTSVISDDGVMLTQVRLEILPGDKRLLHLTLPKNAQFWFAFVNQNGVWPWREQGRILIPLEKQSRSDKALRVELFYSCQIGRSNQRALDLELLAPQFDLPLENITWRVALSDKWELKKWAGSLQLQQEETIPQAAGIDLNSYLQNELSQQRERTKEAEGFLAAGNTALEKGDPLQARRAFQAAFGLSAHDAAFNEDARVQLHNIKLQQALIGLNVRQAGVAGDPAALGGKFRDLRNRKEVNYTQQDAKDIIDRNSADDNAAFLRLAERLVQQQDAAVSSPAALRASVPDQGRVLTFKRAVAVNQWADLKLHLKVAAADTAPGGTRGVILLGTLVFLGIVGWARKARIRHA